MKLKRFWLISSILIIIPIVYALSAINSSDSHELISEQISLEPFKKAQQHGTSIIELSDKDRKKLLSIAPKMPLAEIKEKKPNQKSIYGEVKAKVISGLDPYFEGKKPELKTAPLVESTIVTDSMTSYSDNHGKYFSLVNKNRGKVITYYSSPTITMVFENLSSFAPECKRDELKLVSCQYGDKLEYDYNINMKNNYDLYFSSETPNGVSTANIPHHIIEMQEWVKKYTKWEPFHSFAYPNFLQICGAFFDPYANLIVFSREAKGTIWHCPSSSYSTMIRHEYGHGILHSFLGWPAPPQTKNPYDYHEAIADTLSAFSLNTSCMGLNFLSPNAGCTRDIEDDYVYPVNSTQAHIRGMPLSGAFWDLRKELIKIYGEEKGSDIASTLLLNSIKFSKTGLQPEFTKDLISVDKRTYNGRHEEIIKTAFGRHGL